MFRRFQCRLQVRDYQQTIRGSDPWVKLPEYGGLFL